MPLTPADIHNVEFGKSPLGRRGYDAEQVDALLDEVTDEMSRLLEENDLLQTRARRTDAVAAEPAADGRDRAEIAAAAAELDRARRACDQAEQGARLLKRQLDEARRAVAPALSGSADPARVLAMAQRTADDHLSQARQKSQALLADAQAESSRINGEARKLVSDIQHHSHRLHSESAAALRINRDDVLHQIDDLTRFAENYRAALGDRLTGQWQHIDGTAGGADPA
ncbi:DivIVA domain-containing protein [Actinoplanes sp. NPDC024001]|uniref:DivIVA domain-containing protein n=1 Tax=Actinoplanes sp. NPDC024001 TaxID=3154598 RepID=UPI0033DEC6FA